MMGEMMKQCCDAEGMPDFEKMKAFMESCGKEQFNEDEIAAMKRLCVERGMPDFEKMKKFMAGCGCVPSEPTSP